LSFLDSDFLDISINEGVVEENNEKGFKEYFSLSF
jgi:hypothetical protein